MVAILGELVATVTAPHKNKWRLLYPESLHRDLRRLIWTLWDTLDHIAVTFLCQALATLRATPRPTREDFHDPAEDTTTGLAGDLWDETSLHWGTAGDNLVAVAPQPSVALPWAVVALDSPVAATEAREEPVVATRQAGVATRRGQRVKEAWQLMKRFSNMCEEGTAFPWDLESWLEGLRDSEEWTEEESPDDPEAAVAKALCGAEWLWEASARLITDHLLGTVEEIYKFLWSPCGGSGGPGGPFGRAVAERCQRAIEDIPRLLGDSEVSSVTS
ncbi:hypothetical protein HGM15179_021055 [Zosterops borbonicus]|uniref:Uncharacterized protein n=1 Tax=Zosterops borbonicus TaxID=364589 RepID=A0A8K1FWL2_9PASS|nr:hypothetical protein HGM15179_021055 [Zosterops borbonicus]